MLALLSGAALEYDGGGRTSRGTTSACLEHHPGRCQLPAEQSSPEGPRVELGIATEKELCSPGAVKLIHLELTELKVAHRTTVAELKAERQRSEGLTFRAHSSELDCSVLRERLGATGHRDLVVRLIEIVILGLLAFAIDFARSGSWPSFTVCTLLSVILAIAIKLIQQGHRLGGST